MVPKYVRTRKAPGKHLVLLLHFRDEYIELWTQPITFHNLGIKLGSKTKCCSSSCQYKGCFSRYVQMKILFNVSHFQSRKKNVMTLAVYAFSVALKHYFITVYLSVINTMPLAPSARRLCYLLFISMVTSRMFDTKQGLNACIMKGHAND